MAQVLSATKYNARITSSCQSYEASSLKTSWDKEDLLGRGSFATARRCIHDQLGRVVVKCFKLEGPSIDKDKVMMNVEREMKVLYRLKHQHIVAVHGITEWSNCIGIIMEYAEAGNLDFFLWLPGDIADIPLLLQLRFAHQISDGLRYLHHHDKKRSYLHCDLKPENILLTLDLTVKIADFGSVAIAMATGVTGGSFTITSTTQHTPFYTAPELLGNILSDKKPSMDVYSYGMVLYAILTRHPAFSSDDPFPPKPALITHLIIHCGQKPKQKYLDDAESSLKDKPEDFDIFKFLKDIMVRCWDFKAKNRPDIQLVYDEIDERLRSLNKSDITYHISDLKKNEEPESTPSSVKIELSEFSSPFEVGPQPSTAYLTTSEQSTSATSIQDEVNEDLPALQIQEPSDTEQVTSAAQTVTEIKPKTEPADGAGETASDVAKSSSEQSSSTSATTIQDEVNAGSSTPTTRESPGIKQGTSPEEIVLLTSDQTEQSSSTSATSIQDEVNVGSSTPTTRESPGIKQGASPQKSGLLTNVQTELKPEHEPPDGARETREGSSLEQTTLTGTETMMSRFRKFFRLSNRSVDANKPNNRSGLEIMSEKISSINDLISNQKIDEALTVCQDLKSAMKTTFVTGNDAIDIGNDIINFMSTLSREKYSSTILTLLFLAGDLHKQIDGPTEKVKLMKRCAVECLNFVVRYDKNLQRTTYRHMISRMTGFVQTIQSVKVDDEKLVATSKAQCWLTIASCHSYLAEYSRAIEVLQPAITTLESTFGDGCRKMSLYSVCCNDIGFYNYFNNQFEEAEAFYIKSIHARHEVEDRSEQWKMENIHRTINNLCELYQDYPTMTRDKGNDVYNFLQKRKHLTGYSRFWNILSSLRLMILLNLDGDVKAICNKLVTMATNISPPADRRNYLCIGLRRTAELIFSKNHEESAKSLLECVDKFEK
ncbi:uncharacterized protein LOC143452114 isoform X3 [Clavelina lepadiformis]|uniref:uncharacterized protein LOC143452114 isoform X3 n=1 Tax=Clavelina lepadiformis TaxID=159417 RepID=UPI0040417396